MKKSSRCCLMLCISISLFLTGCWEGQGSAASDSANRAIGSGEERLTDSTEAPINGSGNSEADAEGTQPDIMENPAYNPNGRRVLTAVVTSPRITSETLERIQAFNANDTSCFVEIVDYKAEEAIVLEAEDLAARLPLEILSGKGPDLVIWDGYYTPALASEMLMMDLYDLMDADPEFHREDYFENILQAFERNGGLYILPSSFAVSTMCGKAEELGADRGITEGWEFGEILEAFENSPHAEVVFDYPNKEYTLNYVVGGCMGNFVDWNSGECHFDTPEFVEMLEFCNTLPDGFADVESYYEFYSSGKCFLYHPYLSTPWSMAEVRARFGDVELRWPGVPVTDGEKELGGGVASPCGECFSICRNSSDPEGAWEFIKSYLMEDMQQRGIHSCGLYLKKRSRMR